MTNHGRLRRRLGKRRHRRRRWRSADVDVCPPYNAARPSGSRAMKIEGSNVFVTGGASGLGGATVRALVARGARVAIYDLPRSNGAELEKELGPAARFLAGDVTDEGQVTDALDAAIAAFGPLRGLVNCAG